RAFALFDLLPYVVLRFWIIAAEHFNADYIAAAVHFVFVGFSDDRRLAFVVRFGVVVFVLVITIAIVGVSRRHRVAHDGDESPLGRGKAFRDALGHVGSLLDFATSSSDFIARC